MGGYAAYVWPAYGVAFAGIVAISVATWRSLRRARRDDAALTAHE
jgi:heme exporter protein D